MRRDFPDQFRLRPNGQLVPDGLVLDVFPPRGQFFSRPPLGALSHSQSDRPAQQIHFRPIAALGIPTQHWDQRVDGIGFNANDAGVTRQQYVRSRCKECSQQSGDQLAHLLE